MLTIAVLLLIGIVLMLAAIYPEIHKIANRPQPAEAAAITVRYEFREAIRGAAEELKGAVQQYVTVNAVLQTMEEYADKPNLADQLATHSRQVVLATLDYSVNSLGSQLKKAYDELARFRGYMATGSSLGHEKHIQRIQTQIAEIKTELEAVKVAIAKLTGPDSTN